MATPCIEASGHVDKDGYIRVYDPVAKRQGAAHRIAYRNKHGYLPALLRHTCDNRKCCNPDHLVPGTQADNMRDMVERGRLGLRLGETNNQATKSDDVVAKVRAEYTGKRGELTALGKRYGVSRVTIKNWISGAYR